ncbi:MAG: hypothetical protein GC159_05515 [Phycisphaera sp.]|nr:hypothetical protein [Phycisphaera sp.]
MAPQVRTFRLLIATYLVVAVALLGACEREPASPTPRASVTPAATAPNRLVGHWKSEQRYGVDRLFIGEIDPATGHGSFVLVQGGRPERPFFHEYELLKANGDRYSVRLHFELGGTEERDFRIAEDGGKLIETITHYKLKTESEYVRGEDVPTPTRPAN